MPDFTTLEELNKEINAQRSNLAQLEHALQLSLTHGLQDFSDCISYVSELNYYYSIVDEIKDMEYQRMDLFWESVGMDTADSKRMSEMERRILKEYWKRLDGIPSHTMGIIDCPDCKIPLPLHSYHCDCCGWHDDEKEKEVHERWKERKKYGHNKNK